MRHLFILAFAMTLPALSPAFADNGGPLDRLEDRADRRENRIDRAVDNGPLDRLEDRVDRREDRRDRLGIKGSRAVDRHERRSIRRIRNARFN
ncbi:hypothetical protein [Litoreibacter roseus]|uniref:hypothetical protein n=1 Tax=Litoreibacter roseus TaxID=2601869 RepID=UPI00135A79B5|nr:hypothetical protein [Litoreibacter roseus]